MSNKRKTIWLAVVVIVFSLAFMWLEDVLPLPDSFRIPKSAKATDNESIEDDMSILYEQQIKDWLNKKEEIIWAGLHCVAVNIKREAIDAYNGKATFDNGEQVNVEISRQFNSEELYFKVDLPDVAYVISCMLPGYEVTTIGQAFNAFFANPKWTTRYCDNGAKFIEFTGKLRQDLFLIDFGDDPFTNLSDTLLIAYGQNPSWVWKEGDKICIRFAFSIDGDTFKLWSVQGGENKPMLAGDWEKHEMIDKLFEVVYELK